MDNNSEKLIELTVGRENFKEIYGSTSKGNIYYNPTVKKTLLIFLGLATIFSVSLYHSILYNTYIFLTFMSLLFLLFVGINYCYAVYNIWQRKSSVNNYLDSFISIKNQTVLLTPQGLCVTQDKTNTLEKWSAITNATLHENYISFKGQQLFLFPKKSMTETDFEYFKNLVKEKVINGSL